MIFKAEYYCYINLFNFNFIIKQIIKIINVIFKFMLFDYRSVTPITPVTANICDKSGRFHVFYVKVLGSEETWHTPSILLANLQTSGGKAVFSQIHLEADPSQYEFEESKFMALKQSNVTRLEIFSDLLKSHLGIEINTEPKIAPVYTSGFFLGRHEVHQMFLFQCLVHVMKI